MVFAAASTACRPINAKDLYPVVGAGVPAWKQVKTGNGWLWMGLKVELVENLWNVQKNVRCSVKKLVIGLQMTYGNLQKAGSENSQRDPQNFAPGA